jgi:photosystem II stability/assembly factor-like uncharacterized protein
MINETTASVAVGKSVHPSGPRRVVARMMQNTLVSFPQRLAYGGLIMRHRNWIIALLVGGIAASAGQLAAVPETSLTEKPKLKAVWERVSFNKDIALESVSFPSALEGWAVGAKSTIIHTSDSGKTWDVQLGGDPESNDLGFSEVFFLDARCGWVRGPGAQLMQTTDGGATWQEVDTMPEESSHLQFVSPETGFTIEGGAIYRTDDAGKTWAPVFQCSTEIFVEGASRTLECVFSDISFGSPSAGFAVAHFPDSGIETAAVASTTDGGETWTLSMPQVMRSRPIQVLFWSAGTGLVTLADNRAALTTDGGRTWNGTVAPLQGGATRLAVGGGALGVALHGTNAFYSTNGGRSFGSMPFAAAGVLKAVSFPDARHGYAVGEHGLVYRYEIVPGDYNASGLIAAPMVSDQ